mgnify:CR=1 FL=1
MAAYNLSMSPSVQPTVFWYGFNMLDPLLGGDSERARLLRQAISIAVDFGELAGDFSHGMHVDDMELACTDCHEGDSHGVYTLNRDNAGPESDAINDPYERIVYKNGAEVSSSFTCDNPNSVAIQ